MQGTLQVLVGNAGDIGPQRVSLDLPARVQRIKGLIRFDVTGIDGWQRLPAPPPDDFGHQRMCQRAEQAAHRHSGGRQELFAAEVRRLIKDTLVSPVVVGEVHANVGCVHGCSPLRVSFGSWLERLRKSPSQHEGLCQPLRAAPDKQPTTSEVRVVSVLPAAIIPVNGTQQQVARRNWPSQYVKHDVRCAVISGSECVPGKGNPDVHTCIRIETHRRGAWGHEPVP